MKLFYSILISLLSVVGYSQTILHQTESTTRTVQDPQTVIMAPGFRATSGVSNPFIAKIGPGTENPGGGPTDSQAGANNPSGTSSPPNESFHDTLGNVDVTNSGQLQFSLPISLPPSVNNVLPSLTLSYLSGAGNGIAGYGWSVSGITNILRTGRSIEKDGIVKGISLDNADLYSYNGQRLILKNGVNGGDGAEYYTEKYSNVKIKSKGAVNSQFWQGPEFWEITFEDGSQAWFGAVENGNSDTARNPLEYNIVKWRDNKGNYISYNYSNNNNISLLNSIEWGGNDILNKAHFNKINFVYTTRSNVEYMYIKGLSFIQDKILKDIVVYTENTTYRSYNIEYSNETVNNDPSHTLKYQFVKSITEGNSAGEMSNPVMFNSKPLTTNVSESNFGDFSDITTSGDYNGDGLIDFIVKKPAVGNLPAGYYLYFNAVNSDTNFVYLGTDSNLYPGYLGTTGSHAELHTVNIVPQDNIIKPKQGIVTISRKNNIYLPYLPLTYDIELRYYSIKSDTSVLNTTNNPLVLEYSKTLSQGDYLYDPSIYPNQPQPWFPYMEDHPVSTFITAKEVDIDSDGLSELVLSISDQRCYKRELATYPEDVHRWDCEKAGNRFLIIDKNDLKNNTVHLTEPMDQNLFLHVGNGNTSIMDFDNDRVQDIMVLRATTNNTNVNFFTPSFVTGNVVSRTFNTPVSDLQQYEIKKEDDSYSVIFKKSYAVKGLPHEVKYGDLNGDKNIEILLPLHDYTVNDEYKNGWSIYLNTGNGLEESLQGLMLYKAKYGSPNDPTTTSAVIDIDGDGKGEILNSYTLFDYGNNSQSVRWGLDSFSEPVYNVNDSQFKWRFTERRLFSSQRPRSTITPFFGDFRINNSNSKVLFLLKSLNNTERKVISYQHFNLTSDKNITTITQGDLPYSIEYKELDDSLNPFIYLPVKKELYPYVEVDRIPGVFVVSKIQLINRQQSFRYRGHITHLHGRGVVGFRQIARTSWYQDSQNFTKLWNGIEINPLEEGLPVKEWSIRTNDETKIFPADISQNNAQLLSYKLIEYDIINMLNGNIVSTINTADKPKVVRAILPKRNFTKDFLTDTTTDYSLSYGDYFLTKQSTININNGYSIKTSDFEYYNNLAGVGADYFVGRLKKKNDIIQAYGDTKSSNEEYHYEDNQIKSVKSWNRDNSGYTMQSFNYNGFGMVNQKVISNSVDSVSETITNEYDSKGKFIIKQTNNLGLETITEYNNWGQILKQTDPTGNIIVNSYDNWGMILTTKSNLSGTTTYQYIKHDYNSVSQLYRKSIVETLSNGNILISYANVFGQKYKTSSRSFLHGKQISKIFNYDFLGRLVYESEPFFDDEGSSNWNTTEYDDSVFPTKVKVTSYNGIATETQISGLTTITTEKNGYQRVYKKTLDALGNVVSSTDKGGVIQFSYNAAGEQIQAKYAENIVNTAYDKWGRKSEFNDPSNGIYKYEYDGLGKTKKIISPKGTKEYMYNNLGQLFTQKELSTAGSGVTTDKTITFAYDDKGRIASKSGTSTGKAYSSNFSYDPQGRLISVSESSNGKYFIQKGITYDDKARVISYEKQLYSSGVLTKLHIEKVYSSWNGELYAIKDKNSGQLLWELKDSNAKGQILKGKLGSAEINNLYDTNGFLKSTNHSSAVKPSILQITYSFDAIKNELQRRSTEGDFAIDEKFDYDDNNRLINWTDPVTGIKPLSNRNVYDNKGRITQNDQVGTIKFENSAKIYQATGITLNVAGTQNYNNDLIQSAVYNENNDPVFIDGEKGDVAFQYGLTGMRQRITFGGNFNSDGDGRFTKFYSEDGSFEVINDNNTGKEKHILYIGGNPYESDIIYLKNFEESSGAYKFLHKDYLGSILAISDEEGNKLEQRHFDAWGNFTHLKIGNGAVIIDKFLISNSALLIDRGYTSHEHFVDVGVIHMNGRLYDPLLRRFMNADENIQDVFNTQNYNKYGYVFNNPLIFTDPNGEFAVTITFSAVIIASLKAVVISGLIYTGTAMLTGNASKAGFLKTIATSFATVGITNGASALNIFGNGFWGTVAQGASIGAASGAVTSAINETNILKGIMKGAITGAVVSSATWYYTNIANTTRVVNFTEDSPENTIVGGTPVKSRSYARELYKEFGIQDGLAKEDIYNDASRLRGTMTKDGIIRYKYKGKYKDALGVTDYRVDNKGVRVGKVRMFLSHKAFTSEEQLAVVMQHELNHLRIANAGLANYAKVEISDEIIKPKGQEHLLDDVGHYYIQESSVNFIRNNGWEHLKLNGTVSESVFSNGNYKMFNTQIWKVLQGTDGKINLNLK